MRLALPRQRWLRAAVIVVAALAVLFVTALAWVLPAPLRALSPEIANRQPNLDHGHYLAIAGDCSACHTRPGGAFYAGGRALATPLGAVYSTNITPDPNHGVGRYTLPEFIRLMRQGVARDGRRIYPAMPYTAYTKVSDSDLQDILAYLQHGVQPVTQADRGSDIPWPLSIRWPLAFWNKAFLDDRRFEPVPARSAAWNKGAYLVEGFGHCGTCHTPRGLAFQERAVTNDGPSYLSGAELDGQSAANLRGNDWAGLKRSTPSDIVQLLKTARNRHRTVAGQMAEVVEASTQHMRDDDLFAIATYLKSLSPAAGQRGSFSASDVTTRQLSSGRLPHPGARIYIDSCSACHRYNGQGAGLTIPNLAGNSAVLHNSPDTILSVILGGARLPSTAGEPSRTAMPAYNWRYSDQEIADLATFIRNAWGNQAPPVRAAEVKDARKLVEERARQQR